MSENLRNFTKAVYGMDAVVQRVPQSAWDNPSPCEGWTARDVLAHQVGVLQGAAKVAKTGQMAGTKPPEDASEPVALWNAVRDDVLEALDHPGVLQQSGEFWFGDMSVDRFISIVQWDPLTHAWDIAQAAGIEAQLDEGLAQRSYDTISPMRPNLAKRGLVAEVEVPVAADADIVSRFLGMVGRNPA